MSRTKHFLECKYCGHKWEKAPAINGYVYWGHESDDKCTKCKSTDVIRRQVTLVDYYQKDADAVKKRST